MAGPGSAAEDHTMDNSKEDQDDKFLLGLSTIQLIGVCIASLALLSTMVAIVMLLAKKCGFCHGSGPDSEDGEDGFMGEEDELDSDGERYLGPREPTRVRFASIHEQQADQQKQQKQQQQQQLPEQQPLTDPGVDKDKDSVNNVCTQTRTERLDISDETGVRMIEAQLHYGSVDPSSENQSRISSIGSETRPEKTNPTLGSHL